MNYVNENGWRPYYEYVDNEISGVSLDEHSKRKQDDLLC